MANLVYFQRSHLAHKGGLILRQRGRLLGHHEKAGQSH
jgi:hypothetical protein